MKKAARSNWRNAPLPIVASCYNLVALAGALLGMQYYLPTPPMLSDHLIMNDLRYGGALCGALIGAAVGSQIVPRCTIRLSSRAAIPLVLFSTTGLAFMLLQEKPLLGTVTIISLLIPWLIALAVNRRFNSHAVHASKNDELEAKSLSRF